MGGVITSSAPRKEKKILFSMISVMIVIIIALSLFIIFAQGKDSQNEVCQDTPESTINGFIDSINKGETNTAIKYTLYEFLPDSESIAYFEALDNMIDEYPDNSISVNNIETIFLDEMSYYEKFNSQSVIIYLRQYYKIYYDDYCLIDVNITVTFDDEIEYKDDRLPCVNVDEKWYILYWWE